MLPVAVVLGMQIHATMQGMRTEYAESTARLTAFLCYSMVMLAICAACSLVNVQALLC